MGDASPTHGSVREISVIYQCPDCGEGAELQSVDFFDERQPVQVYYAVRYSDGKMSDYHILERVIKGHSCPARGEPETDDGVVECPNCQFHFPAPI